MFADVHKPVCPGRASNTFLRVIFHIKSGTLWEGEVVAKRENRISILLGLHKHVESDQGYLQQGRLQWSFKKKGGKLASNPAIKQG